MGKKKQETAEITANQSNFGHEIWGLIFLAISVLLLISLISHFVNKSNNILGYYFGTGLSAGLVFFFGIVPVFMFPLAIGYLGWVRIKGESMKIRTVTYTFLLTIESCLLLAIHHLPQLVANPEFMVEDNYIGFLFVKIVRPVFSQYRFGPYFITILALFITILSCFRISPQKLLFGFRTILMWCFAKVAFSWQTYRERMEKERIENRLKRASTATQKETQLEENKNVKKISKQEDQKKQTSESISEKIKSEAGLPLIKTVSNEKVSIAIDANDNELTGSQSQLPPDAEEEARAQLEQELAAFRAKKKEPIKIMSIETTEIEHDESVSDDSEPIDSYEDSKQIGAIDTNGEDAEYSQEELETHLLKIEQVKPSKPYEIPDPSVLPDPPPLSGLVDKDSIERNSMILEKTLMNFTVEGKVVFVSPGPVVTRYEIELAPGIKVSRVLNLHDDISMAVNGQRIRIEAPIPGKSAVGIELPNAERQIVHFKHILTADTFKKSKAKLPVIIGTNISGAPYVTDVTKMPHVLIAGQTGSGKSVCINSVICSLLMTKKPEELRLIMIDPKKGGTCVL